MLTNKSLISLVCLLMLLLLAGCGSGTTNRPLVITPNNVDLWNSSTVVNFATLSVSYSDGVTPTQPASVQWSSSDKCVGFFSGTEPNTKATTSVVCGDCPGALNKTAKIIARVPGGSSVSATVSCAWYN